MMVQLLTFAGIGLLAGAAARNFSSSQHTTQALGTWTLGVIGGLAGGLLSWAYWPAVENQLHVGNLLMALLGAGIVIVFSAGVDYARRRGA